MVIDAHQNVAGMPGMSKLSHRVQVCATRRLTREVRIHLVLFGKVYQTTEHHDADSQEKHK